MTCFWTTVPAWVIITLCCISTLWGQQSPVSVWTAIPACDERECARAVDALHRSTYTIRKDPGQPVLFETVSLAFLPKVVKKGKDALEIRLHNPQDSSLHSPQSTAPVASLRRKEIHQQLWPQFDFHSIREQLPEYLSAYQNAITQSQNLTRQPPDSSRMFVLGNDILSRTEFSFADMHAYVLADVDRYFNTFSDASERTQRQIDAIRSRLEKKLTRLQKSQKRSKKTFKKFLKGKKRSNIALQRRIWNLNFANFSSSNLAPQSLVEITAIQKKQPVAHIRLTDISASLMDVLPQVDSMECGTLDRLMYFLTKSKPLPPVGIPRYRPEPKRRKIETFTLYFEKNKSNYDNSDIAPILEFLRDSSYTIRRAKVSAFASVEGDEENNLKLQKERSEILINLLQQVNEDTILTEIETAENWELFDRQLKLKRVQRSPYGRWAEKTHEEIKSMLEDEQHAKRMEPFLAKQRKAVLKLAVVETLSPERKVEIIMDDFQQLRDTAHSRMADPEIRDRAFLAIAGVRRYVREAIRRELIPDNMCGELFFLDSPTLHLTDFYDMRRDKRRNRKLVCMDEVSVITKAYSSMQRAIRTYSKEDEKHLRSQSLNHALHIQLYAYQQMLQGNLPDTLFCVLQYPNRRPYWPLLMNRLYFSRTSGQELTHNSPCPINWVPVTRANMSDFENDLYYNLIKSQLYTPPKPEDYTFEEFDLYSLLTINVKYWAEKEPWFYDPDFPPERLLSEFERLENMRSTLCRRALYQLKLDLHRKAAWHYSHTERFDRRGRLHPQAITSMEEIRDYYVDREFGSETGMAVARHFLAMDQDIHSRKLLESAVDILEKEADRTPPDPDALQLYFQLSVLYSRAKDAELKAAKEKLSSEAWCRLYRKVYPFVYSDSFQKSLQTDNPSRKKQTSWDIYCEECK